MKNFLKQPRRSKTRSASEFWFGKTIRLAAISGATFGNAYTAQTRVRVIVLSGLLMVLAAIDCHTVLSAPQYIPPTPVDNTMTPAQAKEYMESTSPLKSGGSITHRYSPQSGWQRTFVPGQPVNSVGTNPNAAGQTPSNAAAGSGLPSVLASGNSGSNGNSGVAANGNLASGPAVGANIANQPVLPWETSGRVAQLPIEQYANPATPAGNIPLDPWRAAPQAPTLGIPPLNRSQAAWRSGNVIARPNTGLNYFPYQAYSMGQGMVPQSTNPAVANTVPQLGNSPAGTLPLANPVNGGPVFIPPTGTYGGPAFQSGAYPQTAYVGMPNNSPYRPLVRLQNLPPGTYVGQGVIGQPKAYVDGQPMRNLFRYILP